MQANGDATSEELPLAEAAMISDLQHAATSTPFKTVHSSQELDILMQNDKRATMLQMSQPSHLDMLQEVRSALERRADAISQNFEDKLQVMFDAKFNEHLGTSTSLNNTQLDKSVLNATSHDHVKLKQEIDDLNERFNGLNTQRKKRKKIMHCEKKLPAYTVK